MARKAALDLLIPERGEAETVQQWAYRALRESIISGLVPPGRPITVSEIAGQLSISAMPVREAIRRLIAENALVYQDNRRVSVPRMTASRFQELVDSRVALETLAALRSLPAADDPLLAMLAEIDADSNSMLAQGEFHKVVANNFRFHRTLYRAAPSQVILPLIESLWLQLGPFMALALSQMQATYQVDRHAEALAALRSRDADALRHAIEADIRDGIAHLAAVLPD